MKKSGFELRIVILSIIIVLVVVASGFLSYRSLSNIVESVHRAASPDQQLVLIKEMAVDLSEVEDIVRLYVLSGNEESLKPYRQLTNAVHDRLGQLCSADTVSTINSILLDSIQSLSLRKLDIWEQVLSLSLSKNNLETSLSDIYASFEKQTLDTIHLEQKRRGFFKSIFGKKDTLQDYQVVKKGLEREEIKEEIKSIGNNLIDQNEELEVKESKLIQQNLVVSKSLYNLIAQIEKDELDALAFKTNEADRLAKLTYRWLLMFSITAVLLLLIVIYTFFNQIRRSKAYQKVLKKAKNEAEQLTRAKEMFVANVSHELRTPVNAIYGLAEQISGADYSDNDKEVVGYLMKASAHLKHIVNQTLDFSKIQADRLIIEKIDFSPSDLFNEVISINKVNALNKGVSLNYRLIGELPDALLGDPVRLKQIIINLIGNAIKFTDKGSVTLSVNCESSDNHFMLRINVVDTGIGISEENLKTIFEEFSQVDSSNTRKYGGTGLGLAISKQLVEIQGGTIFAESKLGEGTTVGFNLMYEVGNPDSIKGKPEYIFQIPEKFRSLTVLAVDDEDYNRFLIRSIARKWGMNFSEASNGREAIELCINSSFDLIFMDMRMPEMNGYDATIEIQKIQPNARIIATSASNEKNNLEDYYEAGMKGYLLKPFTEKDFFNSIINGLSINLENERMVSLVTKTEVDLDELKRQSNGDEVFYREMIDIFISSTKNGIEIIRQATEKNDWAVVAEAAHKMAAPCKHLQAMNLYKLIKQLEKISEKNPIKTKVEPLVLQIEEILSDLHSYLQQSIER